jgi:putative aminopeptidase FrvX
VLAVLRRYGSHLGSFSEDHLRNLSLYRKENTGNKPLLMLDAHSDEVGFMVHSISPDGTLRLAALGGWDVFITTATGTVCSNENKDLHFVKI